MAAYLFDPFGWYAGQAPDGAARSTPLAPPTENTTTTPGELRANWTGHAWVTLPYVANAGLPAARPPVPGAVTMRQARLALLGAGLLSSVGAAIDALAEPAKSAARIEWEYSNEVQRHNGFVAQLGPALGLTEEQLDALFIAAAQIK